eukprot:1382076-Amorphochlora_amoeboformis.AAC.3
MNDLSGVCTIEIVIRRLTDDGISGPMPTAAFISTHRAITCPVRRRWARGAVRQPGGRLHWTADLLENTVGEDFQGVLFINEFSERHSDAN